MQLVDHQTFFDRLSKLFESSKDHGSIWFTHKRYTFDGEDVVMESGEGEGGADTREYPCLVRVTDGKDANFSTKVGPGQLHKFHVTYGALLKSSMDTLRKRDKKREKQRSEQVTRRKQRILVPVKIEGPKRGKGRRKRQRRIKATLKQEDSQRRFQEREEEKAKVQSV